MVHLLIGMNIFSLVKLLTWVFNLLLSDNCKVHFFVNKVVLYLETRFLPPQYPSFFTGGFFARGGPDRRELLKNMGIRSTFVAKGWTERLSEASDQHATPPDATKMLTVSPSQIFKNLIFYHFLTYLVKNIP